MDPSDRETQAGKEREDTDAKLRAERVRTDVELIKTRATAEQDADQVVELARARAEEILRGARERFDRDLQDMGAPGSVRTEVAVERAVEDGAVAEERAVADDQLHREREERQRALSALLWMEREATDDGLVVERARADEALATRDDFLGMVSHDLRNMLGGIALTAGVIAKQAAAEGERGAPSLAQAERIQRFAARMNRVLGDLLDVVSLEAGKLHVTRRPLEAADLVKDAVEAFHAAFAAKGVTLEADIREGSVRADLDHDRILQVLANLLGNALKFTEPGGRVTLVMARDGQDLQFSVIDTGEGIPAGQAVVIFERFRQLDPTHRQGLGLGLYISKCIVEAHGGTIEAESPAGGGTALHVRLPAAQPAGPVVE
jgi:signal transduction histidine kinase